MNNSWNDLRYKDKDSRGWRTPAIHCGKNDEEKKIAEKVLEEMNNKLGGKVSTKVSKEKNYCKAEGYHQKYEQKKSLKFD